MFSTILLGVDVSQKMFSCTMFLDVDDTMCIVVHLRPLFFLLVLYFEFWDGKQNSVPYMWKVILTYVLIEGEVNCYVDGLLDNSCKVVPLPTYYAKVFHWCILTCVGLVFKDRWRCLYMFLILFIKNCSWLPNVLFITVQPTASKLIYDSSFLFYCDLGL